MEKINPKMKLTKGSPVKLVKLEHTRPRWGVNSLMKKRINTVCHVKTHIRDQNLITLIEDNDEHKRSFSYHINDFVLVNSIPID